MFNKYKYLKANDKKVLHKVKKQWVIISLALLTVISGGSVVTHVTVNADTNNNKSLSIQSVASSVASGSANSSSLSIYQSNTYQNSVSSATSNSNLLGVNNLNHVPNNEDPIYNQNIHYNAPQGIFGDVESLIPHYNNGKLINYTFYSMYDHSGNGNLQWGRFGTNDFSHFYPVNNTDSSNNIAIPDGSSDTASDNKNDNPWLWSASGSVINNNGKLTHDAYGKPIDYNAELAYFAANGLWLAYSNNGKQFRAYGPDPVINQYNYNIHGDSLRDPFIVRNPIHNNELNAYVASGTHHTMFVFSSNNGINWTHDVGHDIYLNNSGVAESPNIEIMDGKPVLLSGCQPYTNGQGHAYYTLGHFDSNGLFVADDNNIHSLDDGMDNYAVDYTPIDSNFVVGLGKLQSWAYNPKGDVSHRGSYTFPRIFQLDGDNMNIVPIEPGSIVFDNTHLLNAKNNLIIMPNKKLSLDFKQPVSSFNLAFKRQDSDNDNLSYSFNNGTLTIHRYDSNLNNWQDMTRQSNLGVNQLSNIEFYLDNDSIETYIPEIHKIFTWADYTSTRNANYQITTNVPVQANVYRFNLSQAPQLGNINNIISEYSADKAELSKDMNVLNGHTNDSVDNSKDLLNGYFDDIQNAINDANTNITQVNNYNGDARQHVFIALANDDMDIANTKLYQASLQLKNLDNIAIPYLDASATDARIANYYKTSVANSVAKANQQTAQKAAHAADENILNQQKASVAASVNAANQQKANQAAQQADQNILNQQKQSVANSVNTANQKIATSAANSADKSIESSIANSYANSADNSIVASYKNSASASVSAANNSYAKTAAGKSAAKSGASSADKSIESSIANSYAKSVDTSIANSYKDSVANSVRVANQSKANSVAKSADNNIANNAGKSADQSIESSIANSYANSADTSIANSYKDSVTNSVRAANQNKANSAAKYADQSIENSIANSYRNSVNNSVAVANQSKARSVASSANQSIANSEAKNVSRQTSSQSQQPVAPFIPMNNVTPTPTVITSNSINNDNVMSSSSSDLNRSVNASSDISKNVKHRTSKPVMKKSANNQIPLLGLAKRTYFYRHDEAFVFTNRMRKQANVLQATIRPNHHVVYKVQIGKRTGYMYGYLKKLAKPELFTKQNMYIHVGKRMIKLPMERFNRIKINRAVRYVSKNYIKYYVNYGRKRGIIYGKLPKITKRVSTNKGNYSKYYQVIPKRYHYINVREPLLIYNNKHFTKLNRRGSMRKGITVRVKRLVRDGKMTRFELMNGRYITGLKSFVKLMK